MSRWILKTPDKYAHCKLPDFRPWWKFKGTILVPGDLWTCRCGNSWRVSSVSKESSLGGYVWITEWVMVNDWSTGWDGSNS